MKKKIVLPSRRDKYIFPENISNLPQLTTKQKAIWEYMKDFFESSGFCPSLREAGVFFRIGFTTAQRHITAIEKKGWLIRKAKHDECQEGLICPKCGHILGGI